MDVAILHALQNLINRCVKTPVSASSAFRVPGLESARLTQLVDAVVHRRVCTETPRPIAESKCELAAASILQKMVLCMYARCKLMVSVNWTEAQFGAD